MLIRRRLVALVLTIVVGTLASVAAMPVVIGQLSAASVAPSVQVLLCTCGHGADAQCPMHHHQSASSSTHDPSNAPAKPTRTNRWCAGCPDSVDMTLTAMIGFAVPMVDRCRVAQPDGTSASLIAYGANPLDQARPPTSPPPRG